MTGLEIVLFVYLAGWIGTTSYGSYKCETDRSRVVSRGECHAISVASGIAWPVVGAAAIIDEAQTSRGE